MSINLYYSIKNPKSTRLPNSLRDALGRIGANTIPSVEWLRGFCASVTNSEDRETIEALIEVLEEGKEIDLEWA